MNRCFSNRNYQRVAVAMLYLVNFVIECSAYAQSLPMPVHDEKGLRAFLQHYLRRPPVAPDRTTRYSLVWADLKDDKSKYAILYITGQSWCGSGGCTLLIIAPDDSSYRVITKITIAHPPVRILASKSNGWHDIGVWVQGGGIPPGYEAELRFDGKGYPSNPSVPPARRLIGETPGQVVIVPSEDGELLYP